MKAARIFAVSAAAVSIAMLAGVSAYADYSADNAPELEFTPVGGGSFIYCNNPEAIDSYTLMNGNEKPRYVMNNDSLGPGRYYIYLSHYNFTGMTTAGEQVSKDMELDVELTPVGGECEYTLSNIGFQTTKGSAYYDENGNIFKKEPQWGLFDCCAAAMNKSIIDIDGTDYYPWNGENKVNTVKASETKWISEYIPNYSVVHWRRPVHMQAVLEIKSGTMNVNVCAFRSNGKLGDRSEMPENAENGIVRYDRTIKGIADTLPQVEADLSYTIDDSVKDGDYLPVKMHNQYAPDGVINYDWITHISALDDPWAKSLADESGMLQFTYKDKNKLTYYGSKVPQSERDDIWRFDTHHTDTHKYEGQPGTSGADTYKPNYEITAADNVNGYATNLGNYGVTYTYNLLVTNNSTSTRYFTYEPTTQSNILVYTNTDGKESPTAFTKRASSEYKQDIMSAVELPAGKTTEFSVNVILPVNYNGGIRNAFVIHDSKKTLDFETVLKKHKSYKEAPMLTGKHLSDYKDKLSASTLAAFDGTLDSYEILDCGRYYALRWCDFDSQPSSFYGAWWLVPHVYVLDDDFNVKGHFSFSTMPVGMSFNNGRLYVQLVNNEIYSSEDGLSYRKESLSALPEHQEQKHIKPIKEIKKSEISVNGAVPEWAADDFELFKAYGLGDGITAEQNSAVTRADFAGLAANLIRYYKIAELPQTTDIVFKDTDESEIRQLAELGIIKGYEDGSFKPESTITREEAAVLLSRILKLAGLSETKDIEYSDAESISEWARSGVEACFKYGVMNGRDGNIFDAKGDYTVIQSEITMLRLLNTITNSGRLTLPEIPRTGTNYTVYREGYRNGRIELSVYDTEENSVLVNNGGVLGVSGTYTNDIKYYLCRGEWEKFETGYERISNNANAVLLNGRFEN